MTDYTKLIKALRCCGNFEDREGCNEECPYFYDKDCPKRIMCDAADALEAAEQRIAELEAQLPKEGEWIDGDAREVTARCSVCGHLRLGCGAKFANMYVPFCEICGARMKTVTECHTLEEGER